MRQTGGSNGKMTVTLFVIACVMFFLATLTPVRAAWQFADGDVDRDGLDDLALIGNGEWYVWMSGQGYAMHGPYDLDMSGGQYVIGDLDGDRRPDLAMLSGADWYAWRSGNNHQLEGPYNCGISNGVPYLFEFNLGSGRADICVVTGYTWHTWYSDSALNYIKREPFGFDPGTSEGLIPVAWIGRGTFYGYMKDGWVVHRKTYPSDKHNHSATNRLVQGVPVIGNFDGHPDHDLAMVQTREDGLWVYTFFSGDDYQQRGPYQLRSGNVPGVAGMVWRDTNGCYAAATVYDIGDITNALVDVNGTPLVFMHDLSFNTSTGYTVNVPLPFYYAELTNMPPGATVTLSVHTNSTAGSALFYRSQPTLIPEQVNLVEPPGGSELIVGNPVPMSWSSVAGSQGYLVSYDGDDNSVAISDDQGWHIEYVPAPRTGYTVPAASIVTGYAEFGVAALNGDVQALLGNEDTNDSFFITASWDQTETIIEEPPPPPEFIIVKQYKLREKGLTFDVRESDPYRMSAPGRITVNFKLRKRKVSVAFVAAYDMHGNPYFQWNKARVYKRKSKRYSVTFPCQPYSTIVIGTHKARYGGTRYNF